MIKRALQSFENLNGKNVLGDNWPKAETAPVEEFG